jgi:Flp pilus assembly protein TadG
MRFLSLIRQYINGQEAAVLPMIAISFPVILGMAGLGMDVSSWMKQKRALQTAADAAAVAGAYEYLNGEGIVDGELNLDAIEAAALKEAQNNGFLSDRADSEIVVTVYEDTNEVEVELLARANGFLTPMLMTEDTYTRTRAIAQTGGGSGSFCMLSLDPTASGAVQTNGNVDINATGCGIAVNSNHEKALDFGGNSDIAIGDLAMVGGYDVGNNVDLEAGDISTGNSQTPDPYEDLEVPEFDTCDEGDMNGNKTVNSNTADGDAFWDAALDGNGHYVLCGSHTFSGGDHTLPSGVIIVDGGDLNFTTNGTVSGDGVSFVLTNSGGEDYGDYGAFDLSAQGVFDVSAPLEGSTMEGVAVYQDRNAPVHASNTNNITGGVDISFEGVVYMPSNGISFNGNSSSESLADSPCSMIIAKTITMSGSPDMGNACSEDSGVRDITGPDGVRLVW